MNYRSKIHHVKYELTFGGDVPCTHCKMTGYVDLNRHHRCYHCERYGYYGVKPRHVIKGTKHFKNEKELDEFVFRLHKIKMKLAFRYHSSKRYNSSLEKMRRKRLPYGERRVTSHGAEVSAKLQREETTKLTVEITHT